MLLCKHREQRLQFALSSPATLSRTQGRKDKKLTFPPPFFLSGPANHSIGVKLKAVITDRAGKRTKKNCVFTNEKSFRSISNCFRSEKTSHPRRFMNTKQKAIVISVNEAKRMGYFLKPAQRDADTNDDKCMRFSGQPSPECRTKFKFFGEICINKSSANGKISHLNRSSINQPITLAT